MGPQRLEAGCCLRPVLVLLWALAPQAFDIDAHDAIGQTAASAMDQEAVRQVKRLLGGQDASDVAGWGHQVDDTFPGVAKLHFQVYEEPFCGGPVEGLKSKCDGNICLLSAIKHFYGKVLQDEGRSIDYPKIDYSQVETGIKFSDADAVKMLINLLGDLHQPLHLAPAGGGPRVKLRGKEMSLFDVWDKGISEIVRSEESGFWLGGWTHVRAISGQFQKDQASWKQDGPFKSFERWASETVKFACETAWVHPITQQKLGGAESGAVELDMSAYQAWREAWLRQILLAGERTAIVLNDILDASSAKKLHEGSSVKTNADVQKEKQEQDWAKERDALHKAERAARGSPHINFGVLCTNLSIAAVVVPLFLLVANHGLDPRVYVAVLKSLTEGGGSGGGSSSSSNQHKRWE